MHKGRRYSMKCSEPMSPYNLFLVTLAALTCVFWWVPLSICISLSFLILFCFNLLIAWIQVLKFLFMTLCLLLNLGTVIESIIHLKKRLLFGGGIWITFHLNKIFVLLLKAKNELTFYNSPKLLIIWVSFQAIF